jgi:fructokinase
MDPTVLVAGEALVDFLPARPGPLSDVASFTRRPGGAPANVAVGLARLERIPWLWTRVGDDPFGRFVAEAVLTEGVPDRFVEFDPDARTSLAFVTHDETGDREFTFYRDGTADTRMEPGGVDAVLGDVEWVVAGGVALSSGSSREATLGLLSADATVVFDPNARPELWEEGAFERVAGGALSDVDVLKATAGELRALGLDGDSPEELARAATGRGPHTALLTLGGEGSLAVATDRAPWGAREARHPGYEVDVVDTTGAGDAFLAGALASLVGGETDLEAVLAYGNAVAAVTTESEGAMTALPGPEEVSQFLDGRD